MLGDYIRDGLNPRGAEYGATARAAMAARNTQQAMDDMLALAMAPDEETRRQIAQQIYARKQIEARRARRGHWIIVAGIVLGMSLLAALMSAGTPGTSLNHALNDLDTWSAQQAAAADKARAADKAQTDQNAENQPELTDAEWRAAMAATCENPASNCSFK